MGRSSLQRPDASRTSANGSGAGAGDKRTSDQMENAGRLDRNSTLFDALRQLQRVRQTKAARSTSPL